MRETFAGKIRQAAKELGAQGETFSAELLSDKAGLQTYADKRRMHRAVSDLIKGGEMKRVSRGIYAYTPKADGKPQKQEVMWRFLRMRKTVTIEELQETAGATADYAREWLSSLVRLEIVKDCQNGKFRLVKDTFTMPVNEEKARRLRDLRERKAHAIEAVRKIRRGVEELCDTAEMIIASMEAHEA